MGSARRRKIRYARFLVDALDLECVPRPLDQVLAHAARESRPRTACSTVSARFVDLEDELIRALGAQAVEEILQAKGDLHRFRTLQQMPAWRGRGTDEQLRRLVGGTGLEPVPPAAAHNPR